MTERLTVGSGFHRLADAIFAMVAVIREGIAEDRRWRASLDAKDTTGVLTDGSPSPVLGNQAE